MDIFDVVVSVRSYVMSTGCVIDIYTNAYNLMDLNETFMRCPWYRFRLHARHLRFVKLSDREWIKWIKQSRHLAAFPCAEIMRSMPPSATSSYQLISIHRTHWASSRSVCFSSFPTQRNSQEAQHFTNRDKKECLATLMGTQCIYLSRSEKKRPRP